MRLSSLRFLTVAACVVSGCGGASTVLPTSLGDAAGEYAMVAVSGRGPSSGTMTLFADGGVSRRVEYETRFSQQTYYQIGTFRIDAQGLAFSLREAVSSSSDEWPVRGTWEGRGFSIRYPDPADGGDIVETYRRR